MIEASDIETLATQIARRFRPQRIILFGSYASGSPTEDSDVDLLIIMPHRGPAYRAASRVRLEVDIAFPMDILVCSPRRLADRLRMGDRFLADIVERGLVLHESDDRRVGEQGRRRLRRRLHSQTAVKRLTDFAVAVRYPGWSTNAAAAAEAFATCRHLRSLARSSFGLKR